jgi:hypothetical protein
MKNLTKTVKNFLLLKWFPIPEEIPTHDLHMKDFLSHPILKYTYTIGA